MKNHLWPGILTGYADRLPETQHQVTLYEGGTPLLHAPALDAATGAEVYLKIEGANPTGSFKDRGMAMAISQAMDEGSEHVICASTGNTSASAAAYAARAGLQCSVILPAGKIAAGKLAQAIVHGATIVAVEGNFDDCLRMTRELSERYPVSVVNSINLYRLQGQKTAAFEIVDQLGDAPDIHVLPVGNAGNITAYWMGYSEYAGRVTSASLDDSAAHLRPVASRVPQMWGMQAKGASPFVQGGPVKDPETVATAIRIGNPASWDFAIEARDVSCGMINAVDDDAILSAQELLAEKVGVFCEPASAASVAGLLAAARAGKVPEGAQIVCTLTGNGLKDTATALGFKDIEPQQVPADTEAAAKALGLA